MKNLKHVSAGDPKNPASSSRVCVEVAELSIGYQRRGFLRSSRLTTIAAGLNATARRGELTALIGPNGAGKSTLLRTLCGIQPALDGEIRINGRSIANLSQKERALIISTVLTDRIDPGLLTVREVIELGRTPYVPNHARLSDEDKVAVNRAIEVAGVAPLAEMQFNQLSDGQRQRSMTARAMAQDPVLFILDEPTSFLDVPSRVELVDVLRRLAKQENLAIVMSTHELELALRVADHIWLLTADGRLVEGSPQELVQAGRINRAFDRGRMHFDAKSLAFVMNPD